MRQETALIQVKNAKKWIQNGARRVEILRGISLDIPAGQFVAIVGASGSGKSTLLGLLAGLDTPSEGEIWLDGVPIHNLAETELAAVRGRKIGFVFQSYQLIQTLTALENVLLPYELNIEGQRPGAGAAVARRGRPEGAHGSLSGAALRRRAAARGAGARLCGRAAHRDGRRAHRQSRLDERPLVLDLLLERNRKAGTTLVLVTHDPEVASRADRKIVLKDGWSWKTRCPIGHADSSEKPRGKMAKRALSWKRAAAIGWRDLKSAPGKFGFVVLSVAVGVAALVGVRGFSDSFRRRSIPRRARCWPAT
jgi:putative ABC transport system ATP-binding protein